MESIRQVAYLNEALACRYINHYQHLEADGEIINLDYNPVKLYTILQCANDNQMDAILHTEISEVFKTYLTLGKRAFKIARTPNTFTNDHFLRIGQIFNKYHITDHIQDKQHMKRAITIPRLMRLFPHLLAKVVTTNINVECIIPEHILRENYLTNLSPACFYRSTFCLLPKHEDDIIDKKLHLQLIKAMLLAQHEQMEVVHETNELRSQKSAYEQMQATLMNCKVIYDSDHIMGSLRWASYTAFLLKDPHNGLKFSYDKAAEIFDQKFPELVKAVESGFELQPGTGIEQEINKDEISNIIENARYKIVELLDFDNSQMSEFQDLWKRVLEF